MRSTKTTFHKAVCRFCLILMVASCFFLVLPAVEAQSNNQPTDVDLTKIQYGHWKILNWKGEDSTEATFDGIDWPGRPDFLKWILYDPEGQPILVGEGNPTLRGRDGSASAWGFAPQLRGEKCGLGGPEGIYKKFLVLSEKGRKRLEGRSAENIIKEAETDEKKGHFELVCPPGSSQEENMLKNQKRGRYKLQPVGQEGDMTGNPLDVFNVFTDSSPTTIDLTDPQFPKIEGPGQERGKNQTISGADKIYSADDCQGVSNNPNPKAIILYVHALKGGGWEAIINAIVRFFLDIIKSFIEKMIDWAVGIMSSLVIINPDNFAQGGVITAWAQMRNLCDILFILVLLTIALLNLFSETVDAYTIKKLLPRLLIAFILINASLLICRLVVDFSNVLAAAFLKLKDVQLGSDIKENVHTTIGAGLAVGALPAMAISISMAFIGLLGALAAVFLLIFRIVMIWLLVMLAPLAFLAWVIPQTQQLFSKWWMQFLKYVFIGPVMCLILAFGKIVAAGVNQMADKYVALLFAAGTLLAAIAVPLALGGVAMAKIAQWGGRVGKRLWGYTGAKAVARAKEEYLSQMAEKRGPLGRTLGRFQTERGRAKREAALEQLRGPIYERASDDYLKEKIAQGDQQAIEAAIRSNRSHLLTEADLENLSPRVRDHLREVNPVAAGLRGADLTRYLQSPEFDPARLDAGGIQGIIAEGQLDNLTPEHLAALNIRSGLEAQNALWKGLTSERIRKLSPRTIRHLLDAAFVSHTPTAAAAIERIVQERPARFERYLQSVTAEKVANWQKATTLDNLGGNTKAALRTWYNERRQQMLQERAQRRGDVSPEAFRRQIGLG